MTTMEKTGMLITLLLAVTLIYFLGPILTPFFAAFILAYLGNPAVDRLQRWKMPRSLAVMAVFLLMLLLLVLILLLVVPMVIREIAALLAQAPQVKTWFDTQAAPWIAAHLHIDLQRLAPADLAAFVSSNFTSAGKLAGGTLLTLSRSGGMVFAFFLNLVLIPVVTFYLLRDWDRLMARSAALLPRAAAPTVTRLARDCNTVLGAFLRGQLLVMLCLAILYSLGLSVIGLDSAVAIGVIAGLLSFVPYLGIFTGIILALLSAIIQGQGWPLLVEVLIVFGVGQLLSDFVLTPRLVGERIGLHPLLVIFAILAGGELFGFAGVLLALPVAATGTVLVRYAHERYIKSRLYQDTGEGAP